MIESTRVSEFLYSTLAGDATLQAVPIGGVFEGIADPGTAEPYIVFFQQASNDVLTQNANRIMVDELWHIDVVGKADSFATLQTVSDRVDTLLNRVHGSAGSDGFVPMLHRRQAYSRIEISNGTKYLRIGGNWRVLVQPS